MRVSTAITLALTALLTMSLLGAVAVAPAAASPPSDSSQTAVAADRSHSTSAIASPVDSTTAHRSDSFAPSLSSAAAAQSDPPLNQTDPRQVIRLTVQDNGDVRWTIESHFRVTSDEDAAVFRDYAAEVAAGRDGVTYNFEEFRQTAEQTTGREMSIEDAGWDEPRIVDSSDVTGGDTTTDEDARIGIISYSVTWTNFATVEDDRIYFGDAFRTDAGTWMKIQDGQRFVVETQSNYALETPTQLTWDGPYEFTTDELEIVFVQTGSGGGGSLLDLSWWWLLVIGGAIVAAGIGGYLLFRRDELNELPIPLERFPALESIGIGSRSDSESGDGTGPAAGAASSTAEAPAPGRTDIDDSNAGTGTRLEYTEDAGEEIDPELLSDEERVLRMLTQNGGRMKQATIVSETGWSNAKVSQLLSKMDDNGEIEKLRIGRENLITLPGVDPTETN
ncbi:hypothetical protein HYG81_08800 [Natrinema zhouii]|uniref:Helix-turn-helix domain-containing protein n=1 Tax=Natrinema zhouii TaxID=1710539 RepID=A0A7D6H1V7_9EURY|nr:hypothetical protein [Natrinema zhouii]QLK27685.1 hypothetical protein HYG81_08800 [Natrinema zhouii]